MEQTYQPAPRVLTQDVHGEIVLLDLDSQQYFGLNEVGARVWRLVEQGTGLEAILDALEAEFDVARGRLEIDVRRVLHELLGAGLLRTVE